MDMLVTLFVVGTGAYVMPDGHTVSILVSNTPFYYCSFGIRGNCPPLGGTRGTLSPARLTRASSYLPRKSSSTLV